MAQEDSQAPSSTEEVSTSAVPAAPEEMTDERTVTSRTFQNPDGSFTTEVHAGPIHYKAANGNLRPIDTTIVESDNPSWAYETRSASYELLIPHDLADQGLIVRQDGHEIEFRPQGAGGAPTVTDSTVTFHDAYPGVDLTYEATPTGVRELIVVQNEQAMQDFVFDVDPGALDATVQPDGSVTLEDSVEKVAVLDAPYAYEEADPASITPQAVDLDVTEQVDGELEVAIETAEAWFGDVARDYPVVIDPTITLRPASQDCTISGGSSQNDSSCGTSANYIRAGFNGSPRRGLIKFNLSSIPANATVSDGTIALYLDATQSLNSNSDEYRLWRLTRNWTDEATWNKFDGQNNWSNAGGDFETDTNAGSREMGGQDGGYKNFDATPLVRKWVDGTFSSRGVILKQEGDAGSNPTTNVLHFVSSDHAEWNTKGPKLTVTYTEPTAAAMEGAGERDIYTFESQRLNDRLELKVNVASGNLLLKQSDLSIGGTGLDLALDRYYNSLLTTTDPAKLGKGWSWGTGASVRLDTNTGTTGRVIFWGPSGYRVRFDRNAEAGGYAAAAPGIKAELTYDSSNSTYTLEWYSKEKFVFDSSGRLTHHRDRNGNEISFIHDSNGVMTEIRDTQYRAAGHAHANTDRRTTFGYTNGFLTSMSDVAGGRTFAYENEADSSATTKRLTSSRLSSYTSNQSDLNIDKKTTFGYDTSDRLTSITDPVRNSTGTPGSPTTTVTYDGSTRKVNTVTRVTADQNDVDPTWTFNYSSSPGTQCPSQAVGKTMVNGPRTTSDGLAANDSDTTTYCFDQHDRVVKTLDAGGHSRSETYTSNSNVTELTEANAPPTEFTFSAGDNPTSVTLPTGAQATMGYGDDDNPHFPTNVRDFNSNKASSSATWAYDYDDDGNMIEAKNTPQNITFRYCYNPDGTIQRIDQPANATNPASDQQSSCSGVAQGNDTLFSYDNWGNQTLVDPPTSHGKQTLTHDDASRVDTVTFERGDVWDFTYDAHDRVTRIDYTGPGGTNTPTSEHHVTYEFDENGNMTKRVDNTGSTTFTYDDLNRMTDQGPTNGSSVTTYTYDPVGNLKTITHDGRTTSYRFNAANLLVGLKDPHNQGTGGQEITFDYDKNLRVKATYPSGLIVETKWNDARTMRCTYAYKSALAPTLSNGCPSPNGTGTSTNKVVDVNLLAARTYDYTNGTFQGTNIMKATDQALNVTQYEYDELSRLKRACPSFPCGSSTTHNFQYGYDARGNLTSKTLGNASPVSISYNDANEIVSAGGVSYTYDANGNLTDRGTSDDFSYNVKNQIASVTVPGASTTMTYADATSDRRVDAWGQAMSYSQLGLTSQGLSSGDPHTYSWVRDSEGTLIEQVKRTASDTKTYVLDAMGSVIATVGNTATAADTKTYSYEPYGKEISPTSGDTNPWRFASGYYESQTGMLKFGTRYHMPELGRWTQRDPLFGQLTDPVSLNAYSYVGGDPVNAVDPTGRVQFTGWVARGYYDAGTLGGNYTWFTAQGGSPPWELAQSAWLGIVEAFENLHVWSGGWESTTPVE
jgi:RHS repeat-associated protein